MTTRPRPARRSALLICGLLLVLLAVPVVLTWREWRQEKLNHDLVTAILNYNGKDVAVLLHRGANPNVPIVEVPASTVWQWLKTYRQRTSLNHVQGQAPLVYLMHLRGEKNGYVMAVPLPDEQILLALIEGGTNPNVCAEDGDTPLMDACLFQKRRVVQALLEHGAPVNAHDCHGSTALAAACIGEDTEMIQLLLRYHADVSFKSIDDNFKSTEDEKPKPMNRALYFARQSHNKEVLHLLQAAGAKE